MATVSLQERCAKIELLVLDVDGVLTDGRIIHGGDGVEIKEFHVRDGSGIKLWQKAGKRVGILSGRACKAVDIRAAELGIDTVVQGAADKQAALLAMTTSLGVQVEQTCFIGDDLPDVPALRCCGLAVAVADACREASEDAQYVTRLPGGRGAVREVIEVILRCQGLWQKLVDAYRR
ncbi:MAG: phenylphosphate carboxylase subunit delta [Planctomycetes bacterium]|nr:phenylphosphate carboxylase subunit delta [Planctomycetota bacterium]